MTNISAILCTHNRASMLSDALQSLLRQSMPADHYEIVVVDNASTDGTPAIVQALQETAPNLRYVYEPSLGLSHARNRGVEEARAEVVAFMDDDAVADVRWLEEHWRVYEETPEIGAVGGKTELLWLVPRPAWLSSKVDHNFGRFDQGDEPKFMEGRAPAGGNMSLRRRLVQEVGGFSPNLGYRGTKQIAGEESELFGRLRLLGARFFYQPSALVWHKVSGERVSKDYLRKRAFARGVTRVVFTEMQLDHASRGYWLGMSIKALYATLKCGAYTLIPFANDEARLLAQIDSCRSLGTACQGLRMAVGPAKEQSRA